MQTAQQTFKRELLREAAAIVDGIPVNRFNLAQVLYRNGAPNYRGKLSPNHCGTVGCALGWLSLHPEFQALGLTNNDQGGLLLNGEWCHYAEAGAQIFGITDAESADLFCPAGDSGLDSGADHYLTDKALFRHRVVKFLAGR
jgi:hypothetical protein